MDDDRISAGELRELGVPVPENIPDCATVPRRSMQLKVGSSSVAPDKQTLNMNFDVTFTEPFKWFTATVFIEKPAAEPATEKEE